MASPEFGGPIVVARAFREARPASGPGPRTGRFCVARREARPARVPDRGLPRNRWTQGSCSCFSGGAEEGAPGAENGPFLGGAEGGAPGPGPGPWPQAGKDRSSPVFWVARPARVRYRGLACPWRDWSVIPPEFDGDMVVPRVCREARRSRDVASGESGAFPPITGRLWLGSTLGRALGACDWSRESPRGMRFE